MQFARVAQETFVCRRSEAVEAAGETVEAFEKVPAEWERGRERRWWGWRVT